MSGRWMLLYTALCLFTIWWEQRPQFRRLALFQPTVQALVWNRCNVNLVCVQEMR